MKKSFYLIAAAAVGFGLTSCKTDSGVSSASYSVPTYNLITSTTDPDAAEVAGSAYRYSFNFGNASVQLSSEIVTETNRFTVTTESLPFKENYYRTDVGTYQVFTIGGEFAGSASTGERIRDLECELTSLAYIPPTITGLPTVSLPVQHFTIMQYYLGAEKMVRTFWPDVTFRGTTYSHYKDRDGVDVTAENKDILYRVVMDLKNNKATVILYNAKFSDVAQEPVKSNIVLKNLDLKFGMAGYEITGTDVVPECYEAGVGTPNTSYKFDTFTLTSSGDLVNCNVNFEVAGKYSANFSGAYALRVGKTPEI